MSIGLYYRLSLADGDVGTDDKEESNSIENQRLLLTSFVASRDDLVGEIKEYIDDGFSGTNFDRPAFKRMIEDAKRGIIHTIIVKDLSRLGRDYIGTGDYLEQIFPVLGVRFIAVNSMYDSNDYIGKTVGLDISITNLVNTLYSKDLSKKYKSAVRTKWKNGISTYGRLPLGYTKDPNNKGKWLLDPEGAAIVRRLFDLALEGKDNTQIVHCMNEEGILTPGQYKERHLENYRTYSRKVFDEEWLWDTQMVWRIIKNNVYTGTLVQGKDHAVSVGSKNRRATIEQDRVIVQNHHPAIVTEEEWKEAQAAIRYSSKHTLPQKTGFSLESKVKCGNCGLNMAYQDKGNPKLCCAHKRKAGRHSKCDGTIYDAKQIEAVVGYALRTKLALFQSLNLSLKEEAENRKGSYASVSELSVSIETLKAKRIHLYEDYADGTITKSAYMERKQEYTSRIEELEAKKAALLTFNSKESELVEKVEMLANKAEQMSVCRDLTREVANEFIESVVIYDPKHIEIKFTFDDLLQKAVDRVTEIQKERVSA